MGRVQNHQAETIMTATTRIGVRNTQVEPGHTALTGSRPYPVGHRLANWTYRVTPCFAICFHVFPSSEER
jgi:hypothetical protein